MVYFSPVADWCMADVRQSRTKLGLELLQLFCAFL